MPGPWLGETGDAAGHQDPAELADDRRRVRHVMERVKRENAIDALVGQIDVRAVEDQELRGRTVADDRQPRILLARNLQRRRRDVEQDHPAAQLRRSRDSQPVPAPNSRTVVPGASVRPCRTAAMLASNTGASCAWLNGLVR